MRASRADFDWWWDFAPTLTWSWASTYASNAPHWYVIEGRTPGLARADFLRAVGVIFGFGEEGKFYARPNLYLFNARRNLKCWAMPADPFVTTDRMHVLNLATTDHVYGVQTVTAGDSIHLDALRRYARAGDD